jgi:hypothetical protein
MLRIIFDEYRFVKEWRSPIPAADGFYEALDDVTPAAFLRALYTAYAEQYGATRWGDKTPIYSSYLGLLAAIFPDAQFIHLIRDGRDAGLSLLDRWARRDFHIDIYFAARNWVRRILDARRSAGHLAEGSYYECRYETLVANPEAELRSMCDFLDERYAPEMARPHELAAARLPAGGFHDAVRAPPSTDRIGRWREEMDRADRLLFHSVAGPLLEELGYEVPDVPQTPFPSQLRIMALRAKYEALQSARRLARLLKIVPPI